MGIIELKNVTKVYGSDAAQVVALKNVNFELNLGEVVLIMGPSGAGKSTFLTIAGFLQKPTRGEVLVAGKNSTKISTKENEQLRLHQLGFVLQTHNLVPFLTIKEQFELVNKVKKAGNISEEVLRKILMQLGIETLINKYPSELSGGQQQRAAIARALYSNPQVLLADEPTASLDSKNVAEVGQLFKNWAKGHRKAVLLVTHDSRLEKYADHIYEMMDGKISRKN